MNKLESLHDKPVRCPKCKTYGIFRYYPSTGLSAVAHNCIIRGLVTTAKKWCPLNPKRAIKLGE